MLEAMLQRQLMEWQNRARILEQQLRDSQRSLSVTRKRAQRTDTQQLRQRMEELKDENTTLLRQRESQQYSWNHEKNLLKRNISSLEEKVVELEAALATGVSKVGPFLKSRG